MVIFFPIMKTTIDLPDELLIAAKKMAAESRKTLRAVFERGLCWELAGGVEAPRSRRRPIRWVTARGGLPPAQMSGTAPGCTSGCGASVDRH